MNIDNINGIGQSQNIATKRTQNIKGFGEMFTDLIGEVKDNQNNSSELTKDFVSGKDVELHEVMVAGEKARTSLELLMQIRNKALDMYQQITRMQ